MIEVNDDIKNYIIPALTKWFIEELRLKTTIENCFYKEDINFAGKYNYCHIYLMENIISIKVGGVDRDIDRQVLKGLSLLSVDFVKCVIENLWPLKFLFS